MNMWITLLTVLSFFVVNSLSDPIPFKGCKEGNTVFTIVIEPCNARRVKGWLTCILRHGTQVVVSAVFLATFNSSSLEAISTAAINKQVINLPDSGSNPCKGSFLPGCPIVKGKMYVFYRYFDVKPYFPAGRLVVRFLIREKETKHIMGCARVPLVIERNPKLQYNEI